MKRLFVTIMLLPALWQATAQNHDYIYSDFEMKDGSIYTGYVSHQSFSEGTINPNRSLENDKKLFSNDRH